MKKFVNIIIGIILLISSIMNCFLANRLADKTEELIELTNLENEIVFLDSIEYDTIFIERYDTIRLTKCQVDTITLKDTFLVTDSVDVLVPIEVKHYNDTLSETAVSFVVQGYNCEVEHFQVQNLKYCSDKEKSLKTKPFGIGLQLGIGATKENFSPYIGIGISYNIFQF